MDTITHPTLVQLVADGDHDTDGPGGNQLDEGGMSDGVHKGKFRDKG
ncbi:hypothetical protein KAM362_45550 [Aeromonas caviae]|nr:hypothetical protein KAM362_45550 [Aeromonas caviae]